MPPKAEDAASARNSDTTRVLPRGAAPPTLITRTPEGEAAPGRLRDVARIEAAREGHGEKACTTEGLWRGSGPPNDVESPTGAGTRTTGEMVEPGAAPPGTAAALQQRLLAAFKQAMPRIPNAYEQLDQLLGSQITLGMLADIVAYTIDLGLETKVQLLAESDVLRRARLLLEAIAARPPSRPRRPFPPDFSAN